VAATDTSTMPTLVVHLERERARALVRSAFPRRRWKIISTRSAEELESVFRRVLVDAALIDLGAPDDDMWKAAAFAAEFPSAPFFGILPLRPSDTPAVARCAGLGFVDFIVDGIDDNAARDLVLPPHFLHQVPPGTGRSTAVAGTHDAVAAERMGSGGRTFGTPGNDDGTRKSGRSQSGASESKLLPPRGTQSQTGDRSSSSRRSGRAGKEIRATTSETSPGFSTSHLPRTWR